MQNWTGPEAALALLDSLALEGYRYYHSTRAEMLRRLGRRDQALAAYQRALDLSVAGPERRFLEARWLTSSKPLLPMVRATAYSGTRSPHNIEVANTRYPLARPGAAPVTLLVRRGPSLCPDH